MRLTDDQIEEIEDALHDSVQFYDSMGEPNNHDVLAEIKKVLLAKFNQKHTA